MSARLAGAGAVMVVASIIAFSGCAKPPATVSVTPPPSSVTKPESTQPPGRDGGTGTSGTGDQGTTSSTASTTPSRESETAVDSSGRPLLSQFSAIAEVRDVYFDFDKYEIRSQDNAVLGANAAWLKAHPSALVVVEGHCDERGTDEYNLALGERRAKAAVDFLVSQGVAANRVTLMTYGKERPVCTEKDEGCWAKNRRAHFLVKAH